MAKFLFYDDKLINILLKQEKPSGGAAVQAYGWIRGLKEVGQETQVMTSIMQDAILKDDCRDIALIPTYDKKKGLRWLRWIYYRLPYLYAQIKKSNPDYLYQGVPGWQSFILGIICRQLGVKYVLRISNDYLLDDRLYKKESKLHGFLLSLGIRLSYCVLCQNEYQYNIIRRRYPKKLALKIPNPMFTRKTEGEPAAGSRNYIAWLGLFQYQKNMPLLYEIARALPEETFVIAGKEEENCDPKSRQYVGRLRQLSNVQFAGFLERKQVRPFLEKAKFLLNTSRYEGFSNTFLEAFSVGTPVITSVHVNPDAIIIRHELGIVYGNVADLKSQLETMDCDLYKRMANNARTYISKYHSYKELSGNLVRFLETAV